MSAEKNFWGVTLHGFPVHIELQWPFHRSQGGSDWYVLHGRMTLADGEFGAGSRGAEEEQDTHASTSSGQALSISGLHPRLGETPAGGVLHADIALNLSQTIREALPSLDSDLAFWVAVNTARKALDDKQLELLKSGKRQPVPVSSRSYSIRHKQFSFWRAVPEQVKEFVARKVFWLNTTSHDAQNRAVELPGYGSERRPVLISDPCDAQYLGADDPNIVDKLMEAAKDLESRGMVELAGDYARATDGLLAQAQAFHAEKEHALEELRAKHRFERGRSSG